MKTKSLISAKFPFESKYVEVKGSKMHYIDEGEGDVMLFIHGNPTSSYLWRNIIPHLTNQARCIALDHIGMGKSDKPDINYGFIDSYNYLEEFIEKLGLKNITLVIHDWGAMMGFHYANMNRGNVKAIAFMEAAIDVPRYETMPRSIKIALSLMRTNSLGGLLVKRGNIFIKKMLPDLIVRKLTKEEMAYYAAPYPDVKSRKPLHRWPQDVAIKGKPEFSAKRLNNYAKWLKETGIPKLCFYVTPGVGFQALDLEIVQNEFKNTTIIKLGEGSHFLQEDYPHEIGKGIAKWYRDLEK
ncbi:MAG: haloalkane dehalogenase [Moraxellaceae bacterium]|nr:MAG: haloalkane dehalogenase [Moraxellaceae bacterium]